MRTVLRILSATVLFSAAGIYEAVHASALLNGDIWWHLRTGIWILQNHAVPHTGLFSQYSDLPWIASSWGFDVLLATAYRVCGLRSIPLLLMAFKVALAVVTFLLARVGRVNFWSAVLLSILAQYVIAGLQPAPATLSILFFGVELILLLRSLRCGSLSNLFLLPPLFLLWANLHVQFIYGLLLLCILLIALSLERILLGLGVTWTSNLSRPLPLAKVFGLAGLSVLCTLANPYSFRIYAVIPRVLYSDVSFQYFADMHSMSFRRPSEFALMLLVMAAFFALGRNRPPNLFELLALCAGAAVAFRIQRDVWLAVLPAIAILGSGLHFGERPPTSVSDPGQQWEKPLTAVMVVAVLAVAVFRLPGKNALMAKISQNYPVKACDFILNNHLPQPLFNSYSWGGFLAWYLPEYPVVVDSRVELYGDEILGRYFLVIGGKEKIESDSRLAAARTLLLEQGSAMATAMVKLPSLSSRYRMVYSDDSACVFVQE